MKSPLSVFVFACGLLRATTASAQTVADALTFLVTNQSVQTGSPAQDRDAAQATSATITRALLASLATLPVAGSSSAFVYRLNPDLGTVERASDTFGPFFVDRAITAGRGQISFGLTLQQFTFASLDGHNLRDGSLVTTANQFVDERAPFDVDRLTLGIEASVATLYGNVGVTDRVEVGFAAPLVDLTIDGTRVNLYRGTPFTQATAHATAIGLADMVVRAKATAYDEDGVAVAGAVDVRLPTGRTEDLLGTGSVSVKLSAIGSLETGRVSSHVNAGITVGGIASGFTYGGAVALAATNRVTVIGEAVGQLLNGGGGIIPATVPNPTLQDVQTTRLIPDGGRLNMLSVVPGLKWNVSDTWVLAVNVTIPVTQNGLRSPFTPFVGLDYALGK